MTPGVRASPIGWVPLSDWRKYSSLSVVGFSSGKLTIACNRDELHSTIVGEAEAWADHELEMRSQVFRMATPVARAQDSWFAVSVYYWAAFSSCLLLRLLGRPVFRLSSKDIAVFKSLDPSLTGLTEGTYKLIQGVDLSVTTREVQLKKLRSNYHQSLWIALVAELEDIQRLTKESNPNGIEVGIIDEILRVLKANSSYLSDLRNLVNYKADSGFHADIRGFGFSILSEVAACERLDAANLVVKLSGAAGALTMPTAITRYEKRSGEFMFWAAVALSALAQALYSEVASAIGFDRRWLDKRMRFAQSDDGIPIELRRWAPF